MLTDKKNTPSLQRAVCVISSTIFWYLFAHGYRFSNNMFSHDSLLQVCQGDSAWQIALGRFVQPILIFLRGGISNPWLISFCALIWLCSGILLLIDLLNIKNPISVIAVSGIMVCNPTLISLNAAFLQWVDFFALALFLSILGVWLCRKGTLPCTAAGVAAMAISLGIYQAYICVSITLIIILLLRDAQSDLPARSFVKKGLIYAASLLISALLFYLIWQIFLKVFGIWTADSYNGMASLNDYSDTSLPALIAMSYRKVFSFFWNPDTFITMMFREKSLSIVWKHILRCANLLTAAVLLYYLVVLNLRRKTALWNRLFQAALLLLLPAGMNFVCIMSKGMSHPLMVYAFLFLYILAVAMAEADTKVVRVLVWLPIFCVIWSNTVYANQVYLKKELQERAITSLMTRIVSEMESTEGYVPGETPVAFSGSFEASPCLQQLKGFEELLPYGMGKTTLTYIGTDYAFLTYEMSLPMNGTRIDPDDPAVRSMPSYPADGSIAYVGDTLVVKISDSL